MQELPVYKVMDKILGALDTNTRLVLQAPTGAGKTTAVPIALLKADWLGDRKIIVLEPRRLATKNAAKRMAELLGEPLGQSVGYMIRDEQVHSKETKILVITEGILTRMLQEDMALEEVGLIIFDEFHERHLHSDLALALSLESQELLREDLRILVMSATLNVKAISTLLFEAPIIISEGRSFPVEHLYLESGVSHPTEKTLTTHISQNIPNILTKHSGNILIFLPGVKEIKALEAKLKTQLSSQNIIIAPLYGNLPKKEQDAAIEPSKNAERKIVIATNIAESSLNIEGVGVVIDSGLQRVVRFDTHTKMNKMQTIFISQDSATQRAGRAGRFSAGFCYHLWHQHKTLSKHSEAEILNSDLSPMMLELAHWGNEDVAELQWLDLPPQGAVSSAKKLLTELTALKTDKITEHGKQMLQFGTHPRLAHMMLKAKSLNLGYEATLLGALLGEKDIFKHAAKMGTDLEPRVLALHHTQRAEYIDRSLLTNVLKTAQRFEKKLQIPKRTSKLAQTKLGLLLAFAYPDRIAKSRNIKSERYLLSGGKGAKLHLDDSLMRTPFLVISDLNARDKDAQIYSALALDESDIYEHLNNLHRSQRLTHFNFESERIEVKEELKLGSLILESKPVLKPNTQEIKTALMEAIEIKGLGVLSWTKESSALRERVCFINHHQGSDSKLPDMSEAWLLQNINLWLEPHLEGIKTFKALQTLSTKTLMLSLLSWEQQERVNALAPARFKVPSGSLITLNYENPSAPSLEVRLQELFGLNESPKVLNNTLALSIILLSPAHRPMQVTKDLNSFWKNTYAEVRKELRGKYKRHYWPEDPLSALATSKTKKNM